jgi:serine/threonine protein kinase
MRFTEIGEGMEKHSNSAEDKHGDRLQVDTISDETLTYWRQTLHANANARQTLKSSSASALKTQPNTRQRSIRSFQKGGKGGGLEGDVYDFELMHVLGKGGMGLVYLARQTSVGRQIALKMLHPDAADRDIMKAALLGEATVTGQLDHPNIVPVHDLGCDQDGRLFYAMKEVKGTAWSAEMQSRSLQENLDIFMRVADAIAFAHSKGVIHRDIKPENIMLGDYGEVLVMDWGLACAVNVQSIASPLSKDSALCGTPAYMAPEMAKADIAQIGKASDIYLLGGLLYEIITGHPPRQERDPMACLQLAARNHIDPAESTSELLSIALHAMATEVHSRYSSVKDLQAALKECQAHLESITVQEHAEQQLRQAQVTGDYDSFAFAIYGLRESLALWQGNASSGRLLEEASECYARTALDNGDYELAHSVLAQANLSHSTLGHEIQQAKNTRERRDCRIRRLSAALIFMVVLLVVGQSIAFVFIRKEREEAIQQRNVAERERKIAEDAHEITRLSSLFHPLDQSGAKEHAANLAKILSFVSQNAGNEFVDSLYARAADEKDLFLQKTASMLVSAHVDQIASLVLSDDDVIAAIRHISEDDDDSTLLSNIVATLKNVVYVPTARGHGQSTRDALEALSRLGEADFVRRVRREIADYHSAAMIPVVHDPYQQYDEGFQPEGLRIRHGHEIGRVASIAGTRGLILSSDYGMAGELSLELPLISETVVARFVVIPLIDIPTEDGKFQGRISLMGSEGRTASGMQFLFDQTARPYSGIPQAVSEAYIDYSFGEALEIELRYFPDRGRYDVLINDEFLIEEGATAIGMDIQSVTLSANGGMKLIVAEMMVCKVEKPLKRPLGAHLPLVRASDFPLQFASHYSPIDTQVLVRNTEHSEGAEILSIAWTNDCAYLRSHRLSDDLFALESGDNHIIRSDARPVVTGSVGPLIMVSGIVDAEARRHNSPWCGFSLIRLEEGLATEVFRQLYPFDTRIKPVTLNVHGLKGFAAIHSFYGRGLEIFVGDYFDSNPRFISKGFHRPGSGAASDMLSAIPWDWCGKGSDDLFIGWGFWNGYRPILLPLENGVPGRPINLTNQVGVTHLASLRLGDGRDYLFSASTRSYMTGGSVDGSPIDGWGLRQWRVSHCQIDEVAHHPINAGSITSGILCNRPVVVTTELRSGIQGSQQRDLVLKVYGLNDADQLELLWECIFANVVMEFPWVDSLEIADINGDGCNELLMVLPSQGLWVFHRSPLQTTGSCQ